jgi:chromatin structure-remodeling complex subunit RSC1/2
MSQHPVSLRLIQQSLESNQYYAPKYFDIEMMRLFEKGRRYYASVQRQADYGNVIALQVSLTMRKRV